MAEATSVDAGRARADFPRGKKKPGDKIGHSGAETRRVQHLRSPKKRYTMSKR